MYCFSFGVFLVLGLSSISTLALADHGAGAPSASTPAKSRSEGSASPSSSRLRTALLNCAGKLGVLQPSKDYADFMLDSKKLPYVHLFHESGTYIVPLNGEKLKDGSYQALVSFPSNPKRTERILLTVSIGDVEKLEAISIRTTVPVVQDLNPNHLDELKAISAIAQGEDEKNSSSENHFLGERLVPNVGADVQSRALNVATKLPKIENIFADVNFALDLQKAQEAATKAVKSDTTEAQFEADLKTRFADVYNKFDKEIHFKEETQKAMDKLAKEMSDMLAALKVCASTPAPTVSKIATELQPGVRVSFDAHSALQATFPAYIAKRIKGMNGKTYTSLDSDTLKTIQDSIAGGIQEAYATARNSSQEALMKKTQQNIPIQAAPMQAGAGH